MKALTMVLAIGALLAACEPRTIPVFTDDVDLNGDDADDDTNTDDDVDEATAYTLQCTARAVANATTTRVRLRSNFAADQAWTPDTADWVTGTSLTWTGTLDTARLSDDPCPYGCTSCGMCGYVFNVERDGSPWEPRYLLQGVGSGVQQYVDCTLDGPTAVPLTVDSASSNNNGRNFHLNGT